MKKKITLNEEQLRNLVAESIKNVLEEGAFGNFINRTFNQNVVKDNSQHIMAVYTEYLTKYNTMKPYMNERVKQMALTALNNLKAASEKVRSGAQVADNYIGYQTKALDSAIQQAQAGYQSKNGVSQPMTFNF